MALLNCPECNWKVSDSASICPHCGFPLSEYLNEMLFDSEVKRLTSKIKQVEFICPPPHAKVCIKCGDVFLNDGTPVCECGIGGKHFPGVEVDYPLFGWGNQLGSERFIHTNCVIPMNIGDQESEEYIECETSLNELIANYERECESGVRQRNWIFEPTPPKEEWFGKQPPTPEEIRRIRESFTKEKKISIPKCPICGSTHLSKISALKKAAKIYTFGIFGAGDVGKTYKCENCGAKF